MRRNDRYWGGLAIAASGSRTRKPRAPRFDSSALDLRPILRVVKAGGQPNDPDALRRALDAGCVEERDGKYYLTEQGERVIR